MNAPFQLEPQRIPTTETPAFAAAMVLATGMGSRPPAIIVRAWAAAMKAALNGSR